MYVRGEKAMMKFLRRIFGAAAPETNTEQLRGEDHNRGGIIENREPPIPGVIQVASADVNLPDIRRRCYAARSGTYEPRDATLREQ
jgi:hypothetical protein